MVWDTGIGIKPEDQGRIFEEFQQVETTAARQYEGTGLGLALAQKFVELHGGRIWVESAPRAGQYLHLHPAPGRAASGAGQRTLRAAGERLAPGPGRGGRCVDPRVAPFHPRPGGLSGGRGPRWGGGALQGAGPAAVLITLDIMLPKKDGWEVLRALKEDVITREIPVVIVSIVDEPERGFSLGAADYILKPFDREDFLRAHRAVRLYDEGRAEPVQILIIDDDPVVVETLTGLLEPVGFQICKAYGGQQGLELAARAAPGPDCGGSPDAGDQRL